MKYTIEGLSQAKLIELGLDCTDAVILRYILDFYHTEKIELVTVKGEAKPYFWLSYKYLLEQIPIVKIKRRTIASRLKKYVECGLMKQHIKKENGTFSCYRFTEKLLELISDNNIEGGAKNDRGCSSNCIGGAVQTATKIILKKDLLYTNTHFSDQSNIDQESSSHRKLERNTYFSDQSNIDQDSSSLEEERDTYFFDQKNVRKENSSLEKEKKEKYKKEKKEIITFLNTLNQKKNLELGLKDKSIKSKINARLTEGHSVEDFKTVIRKKWREWSGTDMNQYIRPATLFAPSHFADYLSAPEPHLQRTLIFSVPANGILLSEDSKRHEFFDEDYYLQIKNSWSTALESSEKLERACQKIKDSEFRETVKHKLQVDRILIELV